MSKIARAVCEHPERLGRFCSRCGQDLAPAIDPILRVRREVPAALIALAAAASSIAALLLHAAGWVRMPYTITFITLPGTVLLISMLVWTRRRDRVLLFNRLVVGLIAGIVGTIAYDVVRFLVQTLVPLGFDAFRSLPAYGSIMTGRPIDSGAALAAGWIYHISNGLTFGVIYSILAGPARWWWGLVWGTILEASMIVVFPTILQPSSFKGFLLINIIGHAAYGAGVGLWCERKAMEAT